jgi:hypothetical protein
MHPQILEICEPLTARYVAIEPHRPGDLKRAENRAEPSRRQGVEQPGIRSGGNHRNTATEYWIDGRRIRAATQAPQRKRPCRSRAPSVDPSWSWFAALNPFCGGSITREMSEGKSTRGSPQTNTGRAGWVEHSERNGRARGARADFPAPRGSRVRPRHRARLSACLAARARFLAGRSRGLFARDRQQHFPLPFDALAAFLGLCRRGALRLHAATQRLH